MFFDPRLIQAFIYTRPIDCRKAHNGLSALVIHEMGQKLTSGAIFLFFSRDRKTAKALKWDGTGIILFHKKLEKGRFMGFSHDQASVEISAETLQAILAGGFVRFDLTI